MLNEILKRGYFPREFPTPFDTTSYARMLGESAALPIPFSYGRKGPEYISRSFPFNLARRGKLRRALSIPNPINFFHIASLVTENWTELEAHYGKNGQSLSKPVFSMHGRAFEWDSGFELLHPAKLKTRNAC